MRGFFKQQFEQNMADVFIIKNQDGYFLGKTGDWLDGREPQHIFRTEHKDEAVNQLFETNSKNYDLRLSIESFPSNKRKIPIFTEEQLPPAIITETEEMPESTIEMELDQAPVAENG